MRLCIKIFRHVLTAAYVSIVMSLSSAALADDQRDSTSGDYKRSVRSYSIPDIALVDTDGKTVRVRELLAVKAPVMMNFIFTTCAAICPVMTKIFSEVPGKLGADATKLRMISVSIDPENDTPAQLKEYAKTYGATARWTFLTGKVGDIVALQRAFDTYRGDKMSHEPLTLLRSASGSSWVRIDGFATATELAREYRNVGRN